MGLLIFAVFVAVAIGLFLTPGIALFGLVPLVFALFAAVWIGLAFFAHLTPSDVLRRTTRSRLLGPGRADDPDRDRR